MEREIFAVYDGFSELPVLCRLCGTPTGKPIRLVRPGRAPRDGWADQSTYCSPACKMKAYRQRVKARSASMAP